METLILQTKDKKESLLLKQLLQKMNVKVSSLLKEEQEDFAFGNLIKEAVKKDETKKTSIEKIINQWK
jgi:hypothetical protein